MRINVAKFLLELIDINHCINGITYASILTIKLKC
jgi:hypothetical protein